MSEAERPSTAASAAAGGDRQVVEERTRRWIEDNYRQALERIGAGHDPVWDADGEPRRMSPFHFQEIQRKLRIFGWLDRLRFESFIDIGSGFDVYPKLVSRRYGAEVYFSDFAHALNLPYGGAPSGKLGRAVTLNIARLPFADHSFDVVLASEVLEHLVRPIEAIAELLRITRKCLIMTSLEALSPSWWARFRSHLGVDVSHEHVERNFFLLPELEAIFGPHWHHENLIHDGSLPITSFAPPDEQQAAYAALTDRRSLVNELCRAVAETRHVPGAMGILLVKPMPLTEIETRAASDAELAGWLIDQASDFERFTMGVAKRMQAGSTELPDPDRPVSAGLLALLRCPDCRARLEGLGAGLRCSGCGETFRAEYGVPILYPERPPSESEAAAEALQRVCGNDTRRRRIVERVMKRLRRNERPATGLRRLLRSAVSER